MPVIASQGSRAYFALMPALILKMLTLVALVLMPLGMSAASAAPVDHAPAATTAGHCEESGSQPVQSSEAMDCAMTCSMLVSPQPGAAELVPVVRLPTARRLAERGNGLHPDTVTPPPKLS